VCMCDCASQLYKLKFSFQILLWYISLYPFDNLWRGWWINEMYHGKMTGMESQNKGVGSSDESPSNLNTTCGFF
jgi:hypothetical protein